MEDIPEPEELNRLETMSPCGWRTDQSSGQQRRSAAWVRL